MSRKLTVGALRTFLAGFSDDTVLIIDGDIAVTRQQQVSIFPVVNAPTIAEQIATHTAKVRSDTPSRKTLSSDIPAGVERGRTRYTEQEMGRVVRLLKEGLPNSVIARMMGRTPKAISVLRSKIAASSVGETGSHLISVD